MLKKTLLTAVAALAITAAAASISTPDANAGGKFNVTFWGKGGYYVGHYHGHYGGHYRRNCDSYPVLITYWDYGYKHQRWERRTYC